MTTLTNIIFILLTHMIIVVAPVKVAVDEKSLSRKVVCTETEKQVGNLVYDVNVNFNVNFDVNFNNVNWRCQPQSSNSLGRQFH